MNSNSAMATSTDGGPNLPLPQPNAVCTGVARSFQRGGGGGSKGAGGGFPPPMVGIFFENLCMKTTFSCTLNAIIRGLGYVKWHIPILYSPFLNLFYSNQRGGGGMGFMPLSYASDSGAARICHLVAKRGSEVSDCREGVPQ